MFTGIVEAVGSVAAVEPTAGGSRIRIQSPLASGLAPGDSVAVNGVCLTVTTTDGDELSADIGPETARVTTCGALQRYDTVNLERPLRLDARLGGHLVLGHVDGVGQVREVRAEADSHWLTIAYPADLAPFFVRKGSVAVDGVSLTVATLGNGEFAVQVIPFTWSATTLHARAAGARVNLECDMIGKYVARVMELR